MFGYLPPNDHSTIIMRYPLDALANPIGYDLIWDDKQSGGIFDISVWRPIPPPGYICYGDYVRAHSYDEPTSADGYKCIHSRYVHFDNELSTTSQELWWNDIKSGADDDIQVIKITCTTNHFPHQYYRSHDQHRRHIGTHSNWGSIEIIPIAETEYIPIKSLMNGKCLVVADDKNIDGANIIMYDCNGADGQKWKYNPSTRQFKSFFDNRDGAGP